MLCSQTHASVRDVELMVEADRDSTSSEFAAFLGCPLLHLSTLVHWAFSLGLRYKCPLVSVPIMQTGKWLLFGFCAVEGVLILSMTNAEVRYEHAAWQDSFEWLCVNIPMFLAHWATALLLHRDCEELHASLVNLAQYWDPRSCCDKESRAAAYDAHSSTQRQKSIRWRWLVASHIFLESVSMISYLVSMLMYSHEDDKKRAISNMCQLLFSLTLLLSVFVPLTWYNMAVDSLVCRIDDDTLFRKLQQQPLNLKVFFFVIGPRMFWSYAFSGFCGLTLTGIKAWYGH